MWEINKTCASWFSTTEFSMFFFDDPTMVFSIKLHGSISKTCLISETQKPIPH